MGNMRRVPTWRQPRLPAPWLPVSSPCSG